MRDLRTTLRAWAPATPATSHLNARIDIYLRLRGLPGELAPLSLVPLSVSWKRNAPGRADELEARLFGSDLPFDLRCIEGAAVDCWLYEDRNPGARRRGERGHFAGVLDTIERDRYENTITLSCRDMTALALSTKVPESVLASISLADLVSVEAAVRVLLDLIPGGDTWAIVSLAAAAHAPLAPQVKPARPARSGSAARRKARAAHNAKSPHLGMLIPAGDTTVWGAISELCARHCIVPEVGAGTDGHPVVTLVNATDLQTSSTLRPFERAGRRWRELLDGRDMTALSERLELTSSGRRPDFVEVRSLDPVTLAPYSARWPAQAGTESERSNGVLQSVDGITSQAQLLDIARGAFEALAHNQFTCQVAVPHPWSAGGGPDDPDLLDLAYGAAVRLVFPAVDKIRTHATHLRSRGISVSTAAQLASASERLSAFGLMFQTVEVVHDWQGGSAPSYKCGASLRQFLGTPDLPIFSDTPGAGTAARTA